MTQEGDGMSAGPLNGVRVVELAGIGPGPFAAMMLADMGADVIRVDRAAHVGGDSDTLGGDVLARGRRSLAVDLKHPQGAKALRTLAAGADALVEGFRPGVAERLGVGPQECMADNPRLVYGRMTGWGQTGPWADRVGHDLDYIAVAGALHPIGEPGEPPPVPLNYIGDFGGGGMLLAFGVAAALVERGRSGQGQVVDAAMVDGSATMTAMFHGMLASGLWSDERGSNLLDGAAPFYRTYRCADGGYIAVAALEPAFYADLLARLELDPEQWPQYDQAQWPAQRRALAELFATKDRDAWAQLFEGSSACVAPVLSLTEAPDHHHMAEREVFTTVEGTRQPAAAPRFSRSTPDKPRPGAAPGADTEAVLSEAGYSADEIDRLREAGAVRSR
jgi:alpha-methylacyl-CoA racemase